MDSSHDIEARAGAWLARRESGNWSAEDQARLQRWLEQSTANRVAFLRLEAAWERAGRLQALKGSTPAGTVPSPEEWRLSPFIAGDSAEADPRKAADAGLASAYPLSEPEPSTVSVERRASLPRRAWIQRALAASLVLAAVGAIGWFVSVRDPYYRTPVGGMASVPMTDGSKVTLNTDSAVRLAVTERERRIELARGEAFFDVSKDPSRPFVVTAGKKRVVAIGTKFSVRRVDDDVQVFVTEGKVRLEDASLASGSTRTAVGSDMDPRSEENGGDASNESGVLLTAGAVARAGSSGIIVHRKSLRELEDHLSWRAGYLTFRDTALADAVAEFNRYNERKIVIQDRELGALRFSGKVKPTSVEGFVRLLEGAFQIRSDLVDGRLVLTSTRDRPAEG
jgi:transmembrane sensor